MTLIKVKLIANSDINDATALHEVTLVTTGTCAPVEPLRCFAQRVVSGASCAAGAGINSID